MSHPRIAAGRIQHRAGMCLRLVDSQETVVSGTIAIPGVELRPPWALDTNVPVGWDWELDAALTYSRRFL